MKIGSIVFGPLPAKPNDGRRLEQLYGAYGSGVYENSIACNCIGPQPGQAKCPCKLRAESELGRKMVDEGVTVNGTRYRLVPEEQA